MVIDVHPVVAVIILVTVIAAALMLGFIDKGEP